VNSVFTFPTTIFEVFLLDGKQLVQLTNFRRVDTGRGFLSANGRRVFFTASADPLGANPSENCQLFSIDRVGAHLRQVTRFREVDRSVNGCSNIPPGCNVPVTTQDPVTRTVVFQSSCDPLGTTPNGGSQIFAMRPDGSRLRQLTDTRGVVMGTDGSLTAELPGPWGYSTRSLLVRGVL
jgi:Tol biopolymer transport system component